MSNFPTLTVSFFTSSLGGGHWIFPILRTWIFPSAPLNDPEGVALAALDAPAADMTTAGAEPDGAPGGGGGGGGGAPPGVDESGAPGVDGVGGVGVTGVGGVGVTGVGGTAGDEGVAGVAGAGVRGGAGEAGALVLAKDTRLGERGPGLLTSHDLLKLLTPG